MTGSNTRPNPLAPLVQRLREQNDSLRATLRHRAVIEQAKGILVARTGVDPDTAFRQLVGYSQRTNVKLARVAAALVAHAVTTATSPHVLPADDLIRQQADTSLARRHLLTSAAAVVPEVMEPAQAGWFLTVLDQLPAPTILLEPQAVDGEIRDLVVRYVSPAAGDGFRPDASLRELQPQMGMDTLLAAAEDVLESGVAVNHLELRLVRVSSTERIVAVLVPAGGLLLLTWHQEPATSARDGEVGSATALP